MDTIKRCKECHVNIEGKDTKIAITPQGKGEICMTCFRRHYDPEQDPKLLELSTSDHGPHWLQVGDEQIYFDEDGCERQYY